MIIRLVPLRLDLNRTNDVPPIEYNMSRLKNGKDR